MEQTTISTETQIELDLISLSQEEQLKIVTNNKLEGNNFIKVNDLDNALKVYQNTITAVEKLVKFNELPENAENTKTETYKELLNQYKLIISNTAMCLCKLGRHKESVKLDIRIFQKLDKTFDKSYARLVNSYLDMGNFTMANYFASLLKHTFDENTQKKYADILNRLEGERSKHQKSIGEMLSGMQLK